MPTAASCAAATRAMPAKPTNTAPRLPVSLTTLPVNQVPNATPMYRGPNPTTIPTTSLVLVNSAPGMSLGSKVVPTTQVGGISQATHPASAQVKFIDLTMEDDPGTSKQVSRQVGHACACMWGCLRLCMDTCVRVLQIFGKLVQATLLFLSFIPLDSFGA